MSKLSKEQELLNEIDRLQKQLEIANNRVKRAKYGLVWMEVPEAFEDDSENQMPVLEEIKDKAINNYDEKPSHILIEGDNYHALTCLNYTHKENIDLIYIDPPYNTGKDGFTYKDKRIINKYPDGTSVPKDHPLRHSYWLSFMFKRLELAHKLLKPSGKIIISIDDNELSNLVLMCSEIFGSSNQLAILPTIMNLKGNQDQFGFAGTHEYTIVFAKDINKCRFQEFELSDSQMEKWQIDEIGYYKKGAPLRATGEEDKREDRPIMFYPILIDHNANVSTITLDEHSKLYTKETKIFNDDILKKIIKKYEDLNYSVVLPKSGKDFGRWRWGYSEKNKKRLTTDVIVTRTKNGISLNKKQRPELSDIPSKKPKTIFYKPEYSSGNGTYQIKNILGYKAFKNPKPVDLISDLIKVSSDKKATILDFFAGTGTTMHACLELNKSGYNLQCILSTNNEGNICKKVTYPRISNVIKGYTDLKDSKIEGLGGSLKYYQTTFVGRNNILSASDEDKSSLAHKAGYLLALAENTLEEVEATNYYQFFKNSEKVTAVYFKEELEEMEVFLEKVEALSNPVSLYLFSWDNQSDYEGMFDHIPSITIKTIPQPILEIYKNIYNIVTI